MTQRDASSKIKESLTATERYTVKRGRAGKPAPSHDLMEPAVDTVQMHGRIMRGFSIDEAAAVKQALALTESEFAAALGISEKTLQRRREAREKLSPVESDRLYRMARVFATARGVLESDEAAREWLHAPQFGLGGMIPLDMMRTEAGAREVEQLLLRIEYGVIS